MRLRLLLSHLTIVLVCGGLVLGSGVEFGMNSTGLTAHVLPWNLESEVEDQKGTTISGRVLEESGQPIEGIRMDLVPLQIDEQRDNTWSFTDFTDFTDQAGKYEFEQVPPGSYIVAVDRNGAPDGEHPFRRAFYPGVTDDRDAERVIVADITHVQLQDLRLTRIRTFEVAIRVIWSDGTPVKWSNLLVHNPSFLKQAVIGNTAPQITDGVGVFSFPEGFTYTVVAKVACLGGQFIETRESRPPQTISVTSRGGPAELAFVVPGPQCKIWRPR